MSKYCSDCCHMNTNDKKCEGIYKCNVLNEYINANNIACDEFENSYSRNFAEKQRLYDLGKEAKKESDTSIELYIFILITLIILGMIAKLFGY